MKDYQKMELSSLSGPVLGRVALCVARHCLRRAGVDPLQASVNDALAALGDYVQVKPHSHVAFWYQHATAIQIAHFNRCWRAWQYFHLSGWADRLKALKE